MINRLDTELGHVFTEVVPKDPLGIYGITDTIIQHRMVFGLMGKSFASPLTVTFQSLRNPMETKTNYEDEDDPCSGLNDI